MKTSYILEIYEPGSDEEILYRADHSGKFESETPFGTISKGDLIGWPTEGPSEVLRVTLVEHWIYQRTDVIVHKTGIYTEQIESTHELRRRPGSGGR